MLNRLEQIEKEFSANMYDGAINSSSCFEIKQGLGNVMLSAPHSVNHLRNGKVKYADMHTGTIVKYLGEKIRLSYNLCNKAK